MQTAAAADAALLPAGLAGGVMPAGTADASAAAPATDTDGLVLADVLVEEISIDGMCGVY